MAADGINIREQAVGLVPIQGVDLSTIGIVGTAPGAKADGIFSDGTAIDYNEPFLIRKRGDAPSDELGTTGTLPLALDGIYAQGGNPSVVMVIVETFESGAAIAVAGSYVAPSGGNFGTLSSNNEYSILAPDAVVGAETQIKIQSSSTNAWRGIKKGQEVTVTGSSSSWKYTVLSVDTSNATYVILDVKVKTVGAGTRSTIGADASDGDALTRGAAQGTAADLSGMYALQSAELVTGKKPRLIGAPGVPETFPTNLLYPTIQIVATNLRAICVLDGPNTDNAAAVSWGTAEDNMRSYLVDPGIQVAQGANLVDAPLSASVLGLIARNDAENGWWTSPGNQQLLGISKLKRPIDYNPGDGSSRAQGLSNANVATVIRYGGGFTLWGNRTAANRTGNDGAFTFLNIRRTADQVEDAIEKSMFWAVAKGIDTNLLTTVSDRVNGYIRTLVTDGALLGGECYPDADLNTKANNLQGKVFFNVKITGVYPAEQITFTVAIVDEYLADLAI